MKKHVSVMILAAMLCQLAACGGEAPAADTTAASASDEAATTVEATSEYQKPDVDYGGATFTIAGYQYDDSSWKITKYQLMTTEEDGDVVNDAIARANRQVEEEMNIKLELLPMKSSERNDPTQLTKHIMAGDDAFQYAMVRTAALPGILAVPSMVVDMAEVPNLDLSHSWWDAKSLEEYNLYGKQFAAVGDMCFITNGAPIVTFFGKQLVDELKLDNPYQLVYDGKWTYDKMIQMVEAASGDLNGNTVPDEAEDRFGYSAESSTLNYGLVACGIRYTERDSKGEISLALDGNRISTISEKFKALINNKNTTLKMTNGQYLYDVVVPTLKDNRLLFFCNQMLVALDLRDMESDFGILPQPKFDESQKEYISTMNTWFCDNVIIPATNADPGRTGHVLEAMGYYYQQYVTPAFIDTTVLGKSVRDEDSAKVIEMIYDTQSYDVGILFNWGGVVDKMISLGNASSAGFASVYASIEENVKTAMQQTLEELQ